MSIESGGYCLIMYGNDTGTGTSMQVGGGGLKITCLTSWLPVPHSLALGYHTVLAVHDIYVSYQKIIYAIVAPTSQGW